MKGEILFWSLHEVNEGSIKEKSHQFPPIPPPLKDSDLRPLNQMLNPAMVIVVHTAKIWSVKYFFDVLNKI